VSAVRVLYLVETSGRGGTEKVMVQLMRGLRGSSFVPVLGSVAKGWLAEAAREAGVEVIPIGPAHRYTGWNLASVLRLAAVMRRHRIDLVHSFLFHMSVYGTLAARLAGVPCIASLRSVHYEFATWYRRLAWMVTARLASALTAVSEEAAALLVRRARVPREWVTVIPNGVDTDLFRPGPRTGVLRSLGVPTEAVVVGTVGRLDPIKGHRYLLDAAAVVVKASPQCHFVLVGDGSGAEGDALRLRASRLGLDGRVHFLGARDDVATLLREMDIFVLPSLSEGMSNALLEAMATGLPCVATRLGGNSEVIGSPSVGVLVPAGNPQALSSELVSLVRDAARRRRLGGAAQARALTCYGLSAMVERNLQLYGVVARSSCSGVEASRAPAVPERPQQNCRAAAQHQAGSERVT
jgi:glycosyltransferase involved in cell wall biosynthesis